MFTPETRTIRRDGVALHGLWLPGAGTPLIVVPGVLSDARGWLAVARAIEAPVLVLERRGRGLSGGLGPGYGVHTEVGDLLAWIDALGTPARVFGWSYGGLIASQVASKTKGIILYEPVVAPFGAEAVPGVRVATAARDWARVLELVNLGVSRYSPAHVAALRASPAWARLLPLARPVHAELVAINAFRPAPIAGGVPVDLVIGEHSEGVPPYGPAFDRVAALAPAARVRVLPGQGHLAHAADPAALGRMIASLTR